MKILIIRIIQVIRNPLQNNLKKKRIKILIRNYKKL
jgi:hypothetical protein